MLKELQTYLENLFILPSLADYCPNGLQIEGHPEIHKIATAVSADLATIQKAVSTGANALVVHHGIFWNGDPYPITGAKKEKIQLLLQHGISLFAYHLPLDLHQEIGNNWRAAKEMGWRDLQPFGLYKGVPMGVRGKVPSKHRNQFKEQLENYYQHAAHIAFGGKEQIETAALISGGAYKMIPEAAASDVDCFISGSFDEPAWNMAYEEKINFYALGHTATEKVGPRALAEHLQKALSIETLFIDTDNPF